MSCPVPAQVLLTYLYKCTGRAIALSLVLTFGLEVVAALAKCYSFVIMKVFICDGKPVVRRAILYMDRSC